MNKHFQRDKLFLALYFNDYAFEWQLKKKYNLTTSQIQKFSEELNIQGLISFRLLSELSEALQEIIMKTTPDYAKVYNENPKVYIITPNGKLKGKEVINLLLKDIHSNQGLYDFVKQLSDNTKSYRYLKQIILKEEKSIRYRRIKFPNGVMIDRPSKALLDMKVQRRLMSKNSKSNQLVISSSSPTYLTELKQLKLDMKKDRGVIYKGEYSHLTTNELSEFMSKPVNLKEIKLSKDDEIELSHKVNDLNVKGERDYLIMRGFKIGKRERKQLDMEATSFLDRLGK